MQFQRTKQTYICCPQHVPCSEVLKYCIKWGCRLYSHGNKASERGEPGSDSSVTAWRAQIHCKNTVSLYSCYSILLNHTNSHKPRLSINIMGRLGVGFLTCIKFRLAIMLDKCNSQSLNQNQTYRTCIRIYQQPASVVAATVHNTHWDILWEFEPVQHTENATIVYLVYNLSN